MIEEIETAVLVLEEINGKPDGTSEELDRLLGVLGPSYDYVIAQSGGSQRIAMLYDSRAARLNAWCEGSFANETVEGKGLFDRQPLFAHFTLLSNGQPMNDLVVLGVHLASGQFHTENHDAAMAFVAATIDDARREEICVPPDEFDVLICGDFNASRFDKDREDFWDDMESSGWNVLADDDSYPPTRLSGVPLSPKSVIDYVIVSSGEHGLDGEEVSANQATVHSGVVTDADEFRLHCSDHIPVTTEVLVMEDTDELE